MSTTSLTIPSDDIDRGASAIVTNYDQPVPAYLDSLSIRSEAQFGEAHFWQQWVSDPQYLSHEFKNMPHVHVML